MDVETLLFELTGQRCGAPLATVREVFNLGPLTPVPTAPAAVLGVANLRQQVVPVLDVGRLLGHQPHCLRLGDPVVLVEEDGLRAGLLVERVLGLTSVTTQGVAGPLGTMVVVDGLEVLLLHVGRILGAIQGAVRAHPAAGAA